ncbi:MAG: SBBP repeat-containing protein [Acidobacteriota bacterium]
MGRYDRTRELIIDPLLASTLVGGAFYEHQGYVAVDETGDIYIAGETCSEDFPIDPGAYDSSPPLGCPDIFIAKFDPDLRRLKASTFIGGDSGEDRITAIAIDGSGNVYVAGDTLSSDFPTTAQAFDPTPTAGCAGVCWSDAFISKLDSDLQILLASTMVTGETDESDEVAFSTIGGWAATPSLSGSRPVRRASTARSSAGMELDVEVCGRRTSWLVPGGWDSGRQKVIPDLQRAPLSSTGIARDQNQWD